MGIKKEQTLFIAFLESEFPLTVADLKSQGVDLLSHFNTEWETWQAAKAVPEGFVLIDNSELESLKSDNEHFTKSCIDWTDRAYKQRAKVELIKNEIERFKQSGTNLDLSRFLDNLIEFSTFKHDEEFEGFVLVEKCDIEMMLQLIDNSLGYKSAPNKDDTMKIVKNMLIRIGEAKFEGGVLSGN